ncbi:toll/interleukin-1 receptor domain-containing protein [Streptomyces sp. NPDC059949]|uniref:toll/interleukin-1 receptor domain-containing protein n=1 Tax=Streptomyces sp. NPDC059949 TaxID=3347013 RepID=UPI003664F0CA
MVYRDQQGRQDTPLAFISYSHGDSDHHDEKVRTLWLRLRAEGVNAEIDLSAAEQPQRWADYMNKTIDTADFILVVASPSYKRRAEGTEDPGVGYGVAWEAAHIKHYMYTHPGTWEKRILKILLAGGTPEEFPNFLGAHTVTYYNIDPATGAGIEKLVRYMTGQHFEIPPPLGTPKRYPPRDTSIPAPVRTTPPVPPPPRRNPFAKQSEDGDWELTNGGKWYSLSVLYHSYVQLPNVGYVPNVTGRFIGQHGTTMKFAGYYVRRNGTDWSQTFPMTEQGWAEAWKLFWKLEIAAQRP